MLESYISVSSYDKGGPMLDIRHKTFLKVYELMNYTKASEALFITQPAVTQHIKFLEEHYGIKLFCYKNRKLNATKKGMLLYEFTKKMEAENLYLQKLLEHDDEVEEISFGATLSIGEFVMPEIINRILEENKNIKLNMYVENTEVLLSKLENGKISFAFIEGFFDKSKYDFEFFSREKFIPICSGNSSLANLELNLEDIFDQELILREKGSGTRDIFENHIYNKNYTISSFSRVSEIGSLNVIKELVKRGKGISFIYETCVKNELKNSSLAQIKLFNFPLYHDFNFVYLKDSLNKNKHLENFYLFKSQENFHK